jgi:hypothetical protein
MCRGFPTQRSTQKAQSMLGQERIITLEPWPVTPPPNLLLSTPSHIRFFFSPFPKGADRETDDALLDLFPSFRLSLSFSRIRASSWFIYASVRSSFLPSASYANLAARSTNPVKYRSHYAYSESPHRRITGCPSQLDPFDRAPGLDDCFTNHDGSQQQGPCDEVFLPVAIPAPCVMVYVLPKPCCFRVEPVHGVRRYAR